MKCVKRLAFNRKVSVCNFYKEIIKLSKKITIQAYDGEPNRNVVGTAYKDVVRPF